MIEAFHLGGWGMYPTLAFGVLLVGASVWYAREPDRRRLLLAGVLSLVTLSAGMLGFVSGLIATLTHASGAAEQGAVIVAGIGESLNNVGLALTLLTIGGLVSAVGAWRSASPRHGAEPAAARAHA